jgi:hypothetical protein
VYRHDGTTWQFEKKLVADHGNQYDLLGTSVDVSGNVVIGGSFGDDSRGLNSGSATIWSFDGLDWVQDVVLFADDPGPDDHFGRTVAISDTLAVVGSHWKTVGTRFALGAAYVYRNELADWFFEHKLVASDREELDLFGEAVAVYGHTVLVGAIRTDLEGATDAGSTYFYDIPRPFIPPEPVAVEESFHTGPESLRLDGVYPNPFRDRISIELHLESPSALSVTVYNMAGQEVAVVADTFLGSGRALLSWSPAPHLASGMYLVRVNTGSRVVTSKVALIK